MRPLCVFLFFIISHTLLTFPSKAEAAEPLKVGYFRLLPHSDFPHGNPSTGKAFIYFDRISKKMGVEYKAQEYPLPRLLTLLDSGEVDMALFLAKDSERSRRFVYPKDSFFSMTPSLAFRRDHPLKAITRVEDLLPLKIGVWTHGFNSPIMKNKALQLVGLTGPDVVQRNLVKVENGRLDAFYSPDDTNILFEIKRLNMEQKLKVLALPNEQVHLYSPFSKKAAGKYLEKYERALAEVEKEVTYDQFLRSLLQ